MKNKLKVLYLEDSPQDIEIMRELLIDAGYDLEMDCTESEKEFVNMLRNNKYDVILADFKLPGFDGFAALRWSVEICPDTPFIIVSGTIGEEKAIELIKLGAADFILKDRMARLPKAVQNAIERKLVKEELRESEELISLFMQHSPIYVYIKEISPTGSRVLVSSDNFIEMTGIPSSEMKGRTMQELFPAEFAAKITEDDRAVVTNGSVLQLEENFNNRNYTTIKFPINHFGKTLLAGYTIDITERKRAEEALRDSEARYRALFQGTADGILIASFESRMFRYANPAVCRLLGYSEAELRTMSVADIHPKADLPRVIAEFEAQSRGDKTLTADLPCLRKDGTIVYTDVVASAVTIDGKTCTVGFFRDITERKQAEIKISEQLDELRRWYDATADRETKIMEVKREVNELLIQAGKPQRYESVT